MRRQDRTVEIRGGAPAAEAGRPIEGGRLAAVLRLAAMLPRMPLSVEAAAFPP